MVALWTLFGQTPPVAASGVDGAGNVVVIPLVHEGTARRSMVTVRNVGPEPIAVRATYVGAEDTLRAASRVGPVDCGERDLAPHQSATLRLADWCGAVDGEQVGYLKLVSRGDTRFNFVAGATTLTDQGAAFAVPGQPVGAFDPGRATFSPFVNRASLHAIGLRGEVRPPGQTPALEELVCYVASLDEAKDVDLTLLDGTGQALGSLSLSLPAERMERRPLLSALGLKPGLYTSLRVLVSPASLRDLGLVIAGCGSESGFDGAIAYQPARAPEPLDAARFGSASAETQMILAGNRIGVVWSHTLLRAPFSRKVTLATYLRPDDRVQCRLGYPSGTGGFDPRPWLELQVRDPRGAVVAGGERATDTGVFSTGPRGRYAKAGQRWHVDVSFDEAAHARVPWPTSQAPGRWAVLCESSAGMSELLPVDDPTATDDF
jgi:hypothetical protein